MAAKASSQICCSSRKPKELTDSAEFVVAGEWEEEREVFVACTTLQTPLLVRANVVPAKSQLQQKDYHSKYQLATSLDTQMFRAGGTLSLVPP